MAKEKTMRWIAFRIAGIATVLAMASLALVVSPAAATVGKATTTTVTAPSPRTGESITFTATVTRGTLTPTGSVTFSIIGTDSVAQSCDPSATTIGPNQISLTGNTAECTISAGLSAAASPYAVIASYSGDDTFAPSTGMLTEVVRKGETTTSVTSATNPSVTGGPVQFTAVVAPVSPSTGVPTGTVTFSIVGSAGAVPCDPPGGNSPTLDGSDMAQCSVAAGLLAANSPYTVTAVYSGDSNYQTSTGTLTQNVYKATVTLGLTSSAAGSSLVTGQAVSFTATVTGINPPGSGMPTGSVVFSVVANGGATMATCHDVGGDTIALSGSPQSATCDFPKGLPSDALTWTVTATLQDPNFRTPMAGASLVQPVTRASTEVTLTNLPGSTVASQGFAFTATIKTMTPGRGAPTGYYEWAVCPEGQAQCTPATGTRGGTFLLPTPTAKDRAKDMNKVNISVPYGLWPGFYEVQASYLGNADLSGSASLLGHIYTITIPTTMSLVLSHNPVKSGGGLSIKSVINADSRATGALGAPTGTVTFVIKGNSGDKLTCKTGSNVVTISTTLKNQALAKCAIVPGQLSSTDSPYTIRAQYSGDSNYHPVFGTTTVTVVNITG